MMRPRIPPTRFSRLSLRSTPAPRLGVLGVLFWVAVTGAGVLFFLRGALAPQTEILGFAQVIDGDSLRIHGREVRLEGIDAPELHQTCLEAGRPWPCGKAAREALARLVHRAPALCLTRGNDRYGRALATCRVAGRDIGAQMVENGLAIAYGRASRYSAEEAEARAAYRGLWQGTFEAPADYRRQHEREP